MKTLILKILLLLLMVIGAGSIHAQINTSAGTVTSCPGDTVVPIIVTNCNGIGAISLVLGFDNTKLTYLNYLDLNPLLNGGMLIIHASGNQVVISWIRTTAANLGNSTLVKLKFHATPGSTILAWDTQSSGNCEYSDVYGNVLPATFTNGTLTINQPPIINTQPADRTTLVGQNTSITVSAIGTGPGYMWLRSTNGGTNWDTLANNATYSGVATPTLSIANALLSYNGYQYRCRLKGTCNPEVYTNTVTLTVINPVTTTLPTPAYGFCPGNIIVPVTVTNFAGVAAFSLTFSYNTSSLTYSGYQNLNGALALPGSLFVANASGGKVYLTWSSDHAVTFGDGTIIQLLFSAATGTSPLLWDIAGAGNCEFTTLSGSLMTSVFNNGSETIYGLPAVTVPPTNRTIAMGENTTFGVTTSGSGLTYSWQVSTNGGDDFSDLSNAGFYTNVKTPAMTITGAQLAMTGYQYRCKVTGTCQPEVFSNPATLTVLPNVITNCSTLTGCPGEFIVPVNVTNFIGVASFSLVLNYNSSVLTYTGYQNLNGAVSGGVLSNNATGGKVLMTWSNTTAASIANGSALVELKFSGSPGTSSLNWDTGTPGNCEYNDLTGQVIYSTWNNGNLTINLPPSISLHPVNKTIYAGGSTIYSVTATGTSPGYHWQISANGGANWSDLSNISPYSGAFAATLTINPAAITMNGYLYRCLVSGTCPPADTSNSALLAVTQAAITTEPGAVVNSCTGNLNIPIGVMNCNNVGSISLTMVFDTTRLSFEGYHSVNSALTGGILVVNRSGNHVLFSWASTAPANIGTGVLIQYRFRSIAGISTTLSWDTQTTGACEYNDPLGKVIASFYQSSNISVVSNALIVNAGSDIIMQSNSVQLNGSATGGTLPYTYAWTPSTWLSDPGIPNPVALPPATTTYTLTVSTSGCVGADPVDVIIAVPLILSLQNITVGNGQSHCYDAIQTMSVAGNGSTFLVQSGGSVTMIAGEKINYLPGTLVNSGGYMHGTITASGQYCYTLDTPLVANALDESIVPPPDGSRFNVYPNPTPGQFAIDLPGDSQQGSVYVTVYGIHGERIFGEEINDLKHKEFTLAGKPCGIYLIRAVSGNKSVTTKLIKK